MRFTKKLLTVAVAFLLVLALLPTVSFANDEIPVVINGEAVYFADQGPVIIDGRTLVPAGSVFVVLGFTPTWDSETRTATLTRSDYVVVITIDSATFTTNGIEFELDVPAQIINDRTMLPIRAVLQTVGYELDWDSTNRTVVITSAQEEAPEPAPADDYDAEYEDEAEYPEYEYPEYEDEAEYPEYDEYEEYDTEPEYDEYEEYDVEDEYAADDCEEDDDAEECQCA